MIAFRHTSDELGREIASALASASIEDHRTNISTPLLYPSGAHVGVSIDGSKNSYLVSDRGGASLEAELMGGQTTFNNIAREMACQAWIGFDNHSFFVSGIGVERLVTAVIAVANISKETVDRTAYRLAERSYRFDDKQLIERLESVFGSPHVARHVTLNGASTKAWTFSAAVQHHGNTTVFELVRPSWQSLLPTVAKFSDLSDLPDAPSRVAVLADKARTSPSDINLLSRAAKVIDFSAKDDTYKLAA